MMKRTTILTVLLATLAALTLGIAACTPAEKGAPEKKANQEQAKAPDAAPTVSVKPADDTQPKVEDKVAPGDEAKSSVGLPDTQIGLSAGNIFDIPEPAAVKQNETEPGDEGTLPRVHPKSPPVIPHGIAEFLPITRANNACLDCHESDVPVPASHRTDLRNAPGKVDEALVGARYNCVACHVPRTDAKPLVKNTF